MLAAVSLFLTLAGVQPPVLGPMPAAPPPAPTPPPPPAAPVPAKVRVAIPDFQVEGSSSPALALQLQDGFVMGLVRAGVQVVDPVDAGRKLESKPELARCDSSPCLKSIGQLLDVRYLVRVKVEVAGNSYKAVGRIFSTEGASPAALPLANKSKSCDVCTVAEARDVMLRLADALRGYLDEAPSMPAMSLPADPLAPPPHLAGPVMAAMIGGVAMAVGVAVLSTLGTCDAAKCSENRTRSAFGGALLGAGAVVTFMGAYVTIERSRAPSAPASATSVNVAFRF
jgi:hypothetical protein